MVLSSYMIKIKCDHDILTDESFERIFFKNILSVGSSHHNDIIIKAQGVQQTHLTLEIEGESLYIYPSSSTESFLHNSNKTTNKKRVFLGDTFSVENYTFTIVEAEFKEKLPINKIVNQQTEKILKDKKLALKIKDIHERI
jgi:predicted component of type VI protein secretion system